jgi:uncharacterized protein (TIGR02996 family)
MRMVLCEGRRNSGGFSKAAIGNPKGRIQMDEITKLHNTDFIQAIVENPDNCKNIWLQYADWLEEHGASPARLARMRKFASCLPGPSKEEKANKKHPPIKLSAPKTETELFPFQGENDAR